MIRILGPWRGLASIDAYHIRCPANNNSSSIRYMEAAVLGRLEQWSYSTFTGWPAVAAFSSGYVFNTKEDAMTACDDYLIRLGHTLLTEEQMKKVEVLL